MDFKDTLQNLHFHLDQLMKDVSKVYTGNKAASQRVRTGTIKLEKIAKTFRKISLAIEKKGKGQKAKEKVPIKKVKK